MQRKNSGKVLVLAAAGPQLYGGAKMILRLLRHWNSSDLTPILVTPGEGPLSAAVRKLDIDVKVIPGLEIVSLWPKDLIAYLRSLGTLARQIRKYEPQVVLAQKRRLLVSAFPLLWAMRVPRIWQVGLGFDSALQRVLNRICLCLSTAVVIESAIQATATFGRRPSQLERVNVVPKGVDFVDVSPRPPQLSEGGVDRVVVGTLASITPRKGIETLIRGVAANSEYVVKLLIGGDPVSEKDQEYLRHLHQLVKELRDISPPIEFLGWVEDIEGFFASIDVFVLPSRNEGVSGAVREAMGAGLPVIATDVGGMRDLIMDGQTGVLVPANDPTAIARSLQQLAMKPEMRWQLGVAGARHVRTKYDPHEFAARYQDLFKKVS